MVNKKIIRPKQIRRIEGGFSFIPHRFLTEGFIYLLNQKEFLPHPGLGSLWPVVLFL